jgi:hypothetical protein
MTEEKRCRMCGKSTRKVLLKDAQMKIYICSKKCEHEYLETLHGKDKTLQEVLRYFDKKIDIMKKYELCCWIITGLGIVIMLLSIFLANIPAIKEYLVGPFLFLVGVAPLTGSLLLISQVSKEKQKLVEKREQLALVYSH